MTNVFNHLYIYLCMWCRETGIEKKKKKNSVNNRYYTITSDFFFSTLIWSFSVRWWYKRQSRTVMFHQHLFSSFFCLLMCHMCQRLHIDSQGQPRDLEIGINTNMIPSGSSFLQSTRACKYFSCMYIYIYISTASSHNTIDCIQQRMIASTIMMIVFCCFGNVSLFLLIYSSSVEVKGLRWTLF